MKSQRQSFQVERDYERDELLSSTEGKKLTNIEGSVQAMKCLQVQSDTPGRDKGQIVKLLPLAESLARADCLSAVDVVIIEEQLSGK